MNAFRFACCSFIVAIALYAVTVWFYVQVMMIDPTVTVTVVDKYKWRDEWG